MTVEVRVTRPHEYRQAADTFSAALMIAPPDDRAWQRSRPSWDEMPSLSAWDGARCVGHAGQFLVETTVPGGTRLPTGAVSRVGVLPTHRRQGVASELLHGLIRDAATRGLALQSLRASEATIYSRFGFGLAGEACTAELVPGRARPIGGAAAGGTCRLLAADDVLMTVVPLYERVAHRRPGCISRPASFWRRLFRDAIERSSATFVVVHRSADGVDDGYALYQTAWNEGPGGTGQLFELFAATDAAELALWRFLTDIDLVDLWKLHVRPVDDLVRRAVDDPRAYRQRSCDDEQWLRLVDFELALSVRSYQPVDGSFVVRATDPVLEANHGTWRISTAGAIRTSDDPDLITDVRGLSTVYLGATSWSEAAATGLIEVVDEHALDHADRLFAIRPSTFCGTFF